MVDIYNTTSGISTFIRLRGAGPVATTLSIRGAGVQTHSQPEGDERCQGDSGQEVSGEFVVAGCDPAEVLQPAEYVIPR